MDRWRRGLRYGTEGFLPALRLLFSPHTLAQLPRLFTEGVGPIRRMAIQAHNNREMRHLLAEGVPITFVASFARSGNTWMRYLLSDVFLQNEGIQTTTELAIHPDSIIADYYCNLIARRNKSVRTPGVLVKTHDPFEHLRACLCTPDPQPAFFKKCRFLYLFRAPEDSLVSLYHLRGREKYVRGREAGIDEFCRERLAGWVEHVSSYLDGADNGANIYFLAYEQLLTAPEAHLGAVLKWLGVPHTRFMLEGAASSMQFHKLNAVEARDLNGRAPGFRRGRSGSGVVELQPATVRFIRETTASLMARLNRRSQRVSLAASAAEFPAAQRPKGHSRPIPRAA